MKSFRGTFIFTIVVIVACVISYFEVFKKGNEDTEKKDKESQLYKLKAEEISQIELSKNETLILLKKNGDNWGIEKPLVDKADQTAVKNFLDTVLREKTSDLVEEGEALNLKTYGLDQPEFRLKILGATKEPKSLAEDVSFGSVKAYDGSLYSRFAEEKKVYLAPSYLSAILNKKVADFRNKNLFTTSIADVDQIKVLGTDKLEMKRGKETWTLLEPKTSLAPISADSIQTFLDLVRNIKGTDIVFDDKTDKSQLKKYHLDKPGVTLLLHRAQEPKDYQLLISDAKADKDHNIYMVSSDSTSILKGVQSNSDTVNKSIFDFTDKHQPFAFGTADVSLIRVSTSDFKADVKKVGNAWHNIDEKEKRIVDTMKIDDVLSKFNHLEAKEAFKTTSESLKNQIVIFDSSDKEIFKMNWSDLVDDKTSNEKSKASAAKLVYVTTSKIKNVVSLPFSQIQGLGLKSFFKDPDPIQFSGSPPPAKPNRPESAALDQRNTPAPVQEKQK